MMNTIPNHSLSNNNHHTSTNTSLNNSYITSTNNNTIINNNTSHNNHNHSNSHNNINNTSNQILNSRFYVRYPSSHRKEKGIIELNQINQNTKQLLWRPEDSKSISLPIVILCENIAQIKKDFKGERNLLFIQQKNDQINVFCFQGPNTVQFRDQLYDMLNMSPDQFYMHEFKAFSLVEKKRILLLIDDDYLKLLFDEITNKRDIIPIDDFWVFVRKTYPEKMTLTFTEQPIQSSRYDEMNLIGIPKYPITFNWAFKNRLLSSYDDVKKLFEYYTKLNHQKEDFFWREFIKNQDKNLTEIVGGLSNVFFTCEEDKIIKHSTIPNRSLNRHNRSSSKKDMNKKTINGVYEKQYELIERHMNYYDNYENECISLPEYDLNENKLSMEEKYDQKDIANIIASRNDYSSRKIEKIDYIPKQKLFQITHPYSKTDKSSLLTKNTTVQDRDIYDDSNDVIMKNYTSSSKSNFVKKYKNISEKFTKSKIEKNDDKNRSFITTFKRINKTLEDISLKKITTDIPNSEYQATIAIINLCNLIRDIHYIYKVMKDNNPQSKAKIRTLIDEIGKKASLVPRQMSKNQKGINKYQEQHLNIINSFYQNDISKAHNN